LDWTVAYQIFSNSLELAVLGRSRTSSFVRKVTSCSATKYTAQNHLRNTVALILRLHKLQYRWHHRRKPGKKMTQRKVFTIFCFLSSYQRYSLSSAFYQATSWCYTYFMELNKLN